MRDAFAGLGLAIVGVGLFVGAIFGIAEIGYRASERYAPRYEALRRDTFEQSRAFQEGTIRDLDNLRIEYAQSTSPAGKAAIADTARHRLADVPVNQLPRSLQEFAEEVEQPR